MMSRSLLLLALLILPAADWPQFRGPLRDGVSTETGLLAKWPAGGPKLLWTFTDTGLGYAGPAIVGDRLYIAGGRGNSEHVFALDLSGTVDGKVKELWSAKLGPLFQWKGNSWNVGPNATPTVSGEAVYALGGFGDLVCVATATGAERWRTNLPRALGGEVNPIGGGLDDPTPLGWGYAAAPLVDGGQVICTPGGKNGLVAALDLKTGKRLWQSKDIPEQAPYSSPVLVEIGGMKQIVQAANVGVFGIDPKDGTKLWDYRRQPAYDDVVVATPVVADGHVFTSVGFAQGCDLVRVTAANGKFTAAKVFSNKSIENRDGGMVLVGGHLYGHSENKGWFCQEFTTGKLKWAERNKLPRGSIVAADGRLICTSEKGDVVVMIAATPTGWQELGRLKLPRASKQRRPSGGLWTHPVIANGRLYVRDQELLFCYDLKE